MTTPITCSNEMQTAEAAERRFLLYIFPPRIATLFTMVKTETLAAVWHVYILECADGTLYTGVTNDLTRRVEEHNESALGAKYTRARRPVSLLYSKECESRSAALKEEARIKSLARGEKKKLVAGT